jgi:hypothetical protein
VNRSDKTVRHLMLSAKVTPDIVEYPEQGTVRILTRQPFAPPDPHEDSADRLTLLFDRSAAKQDQPRA